MYELIIDKGVIDSLNKLDYIVKARIFQKIQETKENPFHYFQKLSGRPEYKLRIGDYRVIADIDLTSKLILIRFIGHRKNIYEKI